MKNFTKFLFDFIFSLIGLLLTWWLIFFAWIIASIETKSNGLFIQKRVGKKGKLFFVLKIKTMKKITSVNTTITASNDVRITKSGKIFRKSKIDELPQLINVLLGQMSFVGPRPDVPGYADNLKGEDRLVLKLRPGITGTASLKYSNEEEILAKQQDPIKYNDEVIYPDKVRINLDYYYNHTFIGDIKIIINTVFKTNY